MNQDVQILSQTDVSGSEGERVYQLSPEPDAVWWHVFHRKAADRLDEVGMDPGASVETGHGNDEIRISGITAETSVATDQWLSRVVVASNREKRAADQ